MTDISVSLLEGKKNTEGLSISPFVKNMTARIRLTPTLGGNKVRFCLSNENGSSPLVIDQASIARAKGDSGAEIVSGSSIPVTFNGSRKVAIPAGALSIVTQWIWRCARWRICALPTMRRILAWCRRWPCMARRPIWLLVTTQKIRSSPESSYRSAHWFLSFRCSADWMFTRMRTLFHRCHRRFNHEQRYSKTACQADHGRDW